MDTNAWIFDGVGTTPRREPAELREPQGDEVVVRMRAAGVCLSDLHVLNGDWPYEHSLSLGHEGAGEVVAVGQLVNDLAIGDHVVLSWFAPCTKCASCRSGKQWLCSGSGAIGNGLPDGSTPLTSMSGSEIRPYLGVGTFADYTLVPRAAAVKIDPSVPFPVAALIGCSITTGVGAVLNTAEVRAGSTAVVVGVGGVGQSVIMGLVLSGARQIVAIDLADERLEIARSLGATHTINGGTTDAVAAVKELLGGADYVFDAIGRSSTTETLPDMVAPGGTLVLVGMPRWDATVTFKHWNLIASSIRIVGCTYGSAVPQRDFALLAELYLAGTLPLDQLVGESVSPDEVVHAIESLPTAVGRRTVVALG